MGIVLVVYVIMDPQSYLNFGSLFGDRSIRAVCRSSCTSRCTTAPLDLTWLSSMASAFEHDKTHVAHQPMVCVLSAADLQVA